MARLVSLHHGSRPATVVLPVASVENHGILPAGSDLLIAECVCSRLDEDGVAVAPPVPYSVALEHEALGYTVSVPPTVFIEYLVSVLGSMLRHARQVVLAVFHGGAVAASYMAARQVRRRTGKKVLLYSFWDTIAARLEEHGVPRYPIHADAIEASILAACGHSGPWLRESSREEALEEARRRARELQELPTPWLGEDAPLQLYPMEPVPASRELGEELLSAALEELKRLLGEE